MTINYRHGLPVITLTLPTRRERCQFAVKPMVATVGAFLKDVQREDKGIVKAEVFTTGIFHSCLSSIDLKRNSFILYFSLKRFQSSSRFSIVAAGMVLENFQGLLVFQIQYQSLFRKADLKCRIGYIITSPVVS